MVNQSSKDMCWSVYYLLEPNLSKSLSEGILWILQKIYINVPNYDLCLCSIQEREYIFCEQLDSSVIAESVDIDQIILMK